MNNVTATICDDSDTSRMMPSYPYTVHARVNMVVIPDKNTHNEYWDWARSAYRLHLCDPEAWMVVVRGGLGNG
jgi:hypothetical protein